MTPDELKATLERLGLTQTALARLLGISDRTVRRWCQGASDVPQGAARLVKALETVPELRRVLTELTQRA
jgi:DNA-binding transcriptional regulator YiaG